MEATRYSAASARLPTKRFIQNCFKLCPRQALHAKTLGFVHPVTGEQMDFNSEWPHDMQQLIDKWRGFIGGTTRDVYEQN